MTRPVLFGLGAGALWGLTFIAPGLLGPFTSLDLTVVRYLIFGVLSIAALGILRFNPFRQLDARGWWRIIGLGLTGNTLFYLALSSGVAFAGSAPVALIIGTLPIGMIIAGNLRRKTVRWRKLGGPVLLLAAGLVLTGVSALGGDGGAGSGTAGGWMVAVGIGLGLVAVISWLAYGIVNAEYLVDHPNTGVVLWTGLTGLGTFITVPPLAVAAVVVGRSEPVGFHDLGALLFWGLTLGIGSTWMATWLWNKASAALPATILGLLVVSQTVFAIIFVCLLEARWPTAAESVSVALIISGVGWGLHATSARRPPTSGDRDRVVEQIGSE